MSKDGIVYLLMISNVNLYANVILERSLRTNEGHISVIEYIDLNQTNFDPIECLFSVNEEQKV